MKKLLLGMALLVAATLTSYARIGETRAEISARYGAGEQIRDRLPETTQFEYHKNGFTMQIVFQNGQSIWEFFKREDTDITDADMEGLRALLAAGRWTWDESGNCWISQDGRLKARREPGHPDFFSTQDIQAVKAIEDRHKADLTGL
jgi:hypothetical protein